MPLAEYARIVDEIVRGAQALEESLHRARSSLAEQAAAMSPGQPGMPVTPNVSQAVEVLDLDQIDPKNARAYSRMLAGAVATSTEQIVPATQVPPPGSRTLSPPEELDIHTESRSGTTRTASGVEFATELFRRLDVIKSLLDRMVTQSRRARPGVLARLIRVPSVGRFAGSLHRLSRRVGSSIRQAIRTVRRFRPSAVRIFASRMARQFTGAAAARAATSLARGAAARGGAAAAGILGGAGSSIAAVAGGILALGAALVLATRAVLRFGQSVAQATGAAVESYRQFAEVSPTMAAIASAAEVLARREKLITAQALAPHAQRELLLHARAMEAARTGKILTESIYIQFRIIKNEILVLLSEKLSAVINTLRELLKLPPIDTRPPANPMLEELARIAAGRRPPPSRRPMPNRPFAKAPGER